MGHVVQMAAKKLKLDMTKQRQLNKYRYDTYGPISREIIPGFPPLVYTAQPEDAEILFRNESRFPFRMGIKTLELYRKERAEHFASTSGLLIAQGEDWWRMRSKAQQPLLKTKNMNNYLPVIGCIADDFVDR